MAHIELKYTAIMRGLQAHDVEDGRGHGLRMQYCKYAVHAWDRALAESW